MYNVFVGEYKVTSDPVPYIIATVIAQWHKRYTNVEIREVC